MYMDSHSFATIILGVYMVFIRNLIRLTYNTQLTNLYLIIPIPPPEAQQLVDVDHPQFF